MRLWQRLVAILLVVAFVPATLAAAIPLVYCPGADGYPGIEVAQPLHQARAHADPGGAHAATATPSGCIDVDVLSFASVPQRGADAKTASCKPSPQPLALRVHEGFAPSSVVRAVLVIPGPPRAIDRLAAHRTIVLQI